MTQFVLDQLAAAGLSVIQRDGRLFLEPNDLLTNELLQLAREHKHDLLAHLASAEVESNNNVSNRQTSSVSPPAWGANDCVLSASLQFLARTRRTWEDAGLGMA